MFKSSNQAILYNDFDFNSFIVWFNSLDDGLRLYDISDKKFTSIDYIEQVSSTQYEGFNKVFIGMFSTGNYGSRRNLKNSMNNGRRENPKLIVEGEEQENYFLLCFKTGGDIELILQNAGRGVTSNNIKNYLDTFFNKFLTANEVEREFVLKEGTIIETTNTMIDRLDRVTTTKIYIDKDILGDEYLNLSTRTLQAKAELVIDVRAQRGQDIRDFLNDVRQNLVYQTKIDKIWIEGKDANGNPSSFYIDQIQKSVFVDIEVDEGTASIIRTDIKRKLLQLI
jgi:hypothetical protein